MEISRRLSKCKTALVLEHPFIGNVAMNMPFKLTEDVPTAATNGKQVVFNPNFCDELNDEELKFLIAHECMHPMMEHNFRRQSREPRKWNQAADYVINKLLSDEGIGKMPDCGLLSDDIYDAGGGTSDGIYKILPDTPEGTDDPLDDCQDGEGSPAELEQQAAEWKVKVAQAAQAAKMMGKMSAGLERLVDEILQPKVNWAEVMTNFLVKKRTNDRTFSRPNRRFIQQGLYLPSITGEALGEVAFCVDCSGSIGQEELNQYAAEIIKVHEDLHPEKIHVLYFDSEVSHYDMYEQNESPVIKPHGGGGTAFSPCFRYMEKHDINPVACVFLTDLYCDDFGDTPDYPVLWISTTDEDQVPFGEVVKMEV